MFKRVLSQVIAFRDFIFRTGTATMQCVNIYFAMSFALTFLINENDISKIGLYSNFVGTDWWFYLLLIAVFQFIFLVIPSIRCNALSGFTLLVSAPCWGIVSMNFTNGQVFNTGSAVYFGLAVMCGLAGWKLIDVYDLKRCRSNDGGNGVGHDFVKNNSDKVMEPSDVGKPNARDSRADNATSHICDDRWADRSLCTSDTES